MLRAHGISHAGRVRKTNEDALICELDLGLFMVADGMGGHNAGEVASHLAIETIRTFVLRTRDDNEATWPYGFDPQLSYDANRLLTAIKLANRQVFAASESCEAYAGMGTTVVAALIKETQLVFSSAGDSRLYTFLHGTLTQLTRDDSWVATVLAEKVGLDEAGLARHPMRHVLTNAIGAREQTEIEASERVLADGEILLLCSDGLHGAVDDATIGEVLRTGADVVFVAERLVELALERDSRDNITAVVVDYRA